MSFLYVELAKGEPPNWNNRYDYFTSGRIAIESQFNLRNMNLVQRRDLTDGRRIYRVWPAEQRKLPVDRRGAYLFDPRTTNGKFRFTETLPGENSQVLRDWTTIRS